MAAFADRLTPDLVAAWLVRFCDGWHEADTDSLVELFTPDGAFWETPFGPPDVGWAAMRRGWDELWRFQTQRRMNADVLCVAGDFALARWWATYVRLPDEVERELDGIFLLRFANDGRCRELIEWRHARDDGVVVET